MRGRKYIKYVLGIIVILFILLCSGDKVHAPRKEGYYYVEPRYREVVVEATAYTSSVEECGKTDGITSSGSWVGERQIAADDLPFGTRVIIGEDEYTVTDRFGGGYREKIDIWMPTKVEAFAFGRRMITVKIIEEE